MEFKETGQSISLHGLGFVQVKLQGGQRLHVWHPDLPRRKCFKHSQIHDHRFGFESLILVGRQRNDIYSVIPHDAAHGTTHDAYNHTGPRSARGNRPWTMNGSVYMHLQSTEIIEPSGKYTMLPLVAHATTPLDNGRVATIMRKTSEGMIGATSYCEHGIEPEADFDRFQLPDAELWDAVNDVLGLRVQAA